MKRLLFSTLLITSLVLTACGPGQVASDGGETETGEELSCFPSSSEEAYNLGVYYVTDEVAQFFIPTTSLPDLDPNSDLTGITCFEYYTGYTGNNNGDLVKKQVSTLPGSIYTSEQDHYPMACSVGCCEDSDCNEFYSGEGTPLCIHSNIVGKEDMGLCSFPCENDSDGPPNSTCAENGYSQWQTF